MNPNDKGSDKELMPLTGDAAGQQLLTTSEPSGPTQLNPPRVNRQLTSLTPLERAAEVLRYSVLRAEYWLSPDGVMRQRVRFAVRLWVYVMIAALIAPGITAVIQRVTGWTAMSAEIVRNITEIPLGLGKFLLACFALMILFRLLFRR
jgi:hypothetical protein